MTPGPGEGGPGRLGEPSEREAPRFGDRLPSSTLLSRAGTISQSEVLGFLPARKPKLLHLSPVMNSA